MSKFFYSQLSPLLAVPIIRSLCIKMTAILIDPFLHVLLDAVFITNRFISPFIKSL